jgi:tether containing UBX domain for GLUT4
MYYETPVLNIMGRELASFVDFQKTLAQLGFNSGSVLIRLSYRLSGQTLFEAMEEISQHFKEEGPAESSSSSEFAPPQALPETKPQTQADTPMGNTESVSEPVTAALDGTAVPSAPAANDASTETRPASASPHSADPYQPVNVFLAPSGPVPAATLAPTSEADYTPTIAHAQLHQSRLQESSRNKRLLSDKELADKAAAEESRLAAVKSLLIKIRFPDNTSSDWQVGPDATGHFLYEAVRHVMASPDQPFHLTLPGSERKVVKDEEGDAHNLVRGYKLSGRVLLNLIWENSVPAAMRRQPFLKANVAKQGQEIKVPEVPQHVQETGESSGQKHALEDKKPEKSGDGAAKKIPKWLKLGKK